MSLNLTVYVGPYLEVVGVSDELIEKYEHLIASGQGEATDWNSKTRYLIPNRKIDGIDRQTTFDRHDYPSPVPCMSSSNETKYFTADVLPVLGAINTSGGSYAVKWGVVCGVF